MVDRQRLRDAARTVPGLGVLLWGSQAPGSADDRSDVDLCIVAGPDTDPVDALRTAWRTFRDPGIDVRVFEDLPMYLQGAVLEANEVLASPDEPALFEYLRPYWKRWADQAHRQRLTLEEARAMLAASA